MTFHDIQMPDDVSDDEAYMVTERTSVIVPDDEVVYDKYEPFFWSAVEQGAYDDDPNPYHGDYSEW